MVLRRKQSAAFFDTTPPCGLNLSNRHHSIWSAVNLEELLQCLLHVSEDYQMPALRISLADQSGVANELQPQPHSESTASAKLGLRR